MIQRVLHSRQFLACLLSAATGMALYFRTPFPEDNIFLRVMAIRSASAFLFFKYFLHPLPLYNPLPRVSVLLSAYIFRSRQAARFGQADCLSTQTPEKGRTFSPGG